MRYIKTAYYYYLSTAKATRESFEQRLGLTAKNGPKYLKRTQNVVVILECTSNVQEGTNNVYSGSFQPQSDSFRLYWVWANHYIPVTLIRNQQESSRTSRNEELSKFGPHSGGNLKLSQLLQKCLPFLQNDRVTSTAKWRYNSSWSRFMWFGFPLECDQNPSNALRMS